MLLVDPAEYSYVNHHLVVLVQRKVRFSEPFELLFSSLSHEHRWVEVTSSRVFFGSQLIVTNRLDLHHHRASN